MQRYICIHGHFYQPPRENAWLEAIEYQPSAHPYHDWNQRINAECYAPNARSRILDAKGRITRIFNNYSRISFNFGPTLLSWLESHDQETYRQIIEADALSRERFSGHGSALAQAYSHPILPLCNARDKRSQVLWGISDFKRRFGRRPEGMWLPETAVDLESLEVLVANGIGFTILAPSQARRVRPLESADWTELAHETIDPRMPYLLKLPSGARINIFFYDGSLSRAVAFERLLSRGEWFANRLVGAFDSADRPQLVHIATDGETYGHHHRFGDMALAYALHDIESRERARLTNYGEYLELHPPTHEVEIVERSSWSCAHDLGRWSEDCGCSNGSHPEWNQTWRAPLRRAFDSLRDTLAPLYEEHAARYLHDPWAARDDYIDVVLDRSEIAVERFLERHAIHKLDTEERIRVLKLLELQRHLMLIYTSCGWFFDEISRIETLQVLQYAGRVLQLEEELLERECEQELFLALLQDAPSNVADIQNGRVLFESKVRSASVDLLKVGANFAAGLLFADTPGSQEHIGFEINWLDKRNLRSAKTRLALGRFRVTSRITLESADLIFGFLHHGEEHLKGGVIPFPGEPSYRTMIEEFSELFARNGATQIEELLERHFPGTPYTLATLFRDEQQRTLQRILESTLSDVEAVYRQLYKDHAPLMRFLASLDTGQPRALRVAAELVVNTGLLRELERPQFNPESFTELLEDARKNQIPLDEPSIGYAASLTMERSLRRLTQRPGELAVLERTGATVKLIRSLGFTLELNDAENLCYGMAQQLYPGYRARAESGDQQARQWIESFLPLCAELRIAVDA